MEPVSDLRHQTFHRPFPLPDKPWKYYQEWHDVLFCHWKVKAEKIAALLPDSVTLDTFEGDAWVSMVSFAVKNLRMRYFPPFTPVSDFNEVNLRTYVVKDDKPGIYFFSIEADKMLSVLFSRSLIGIRYKKADIRKKLNEHLVTNPDQKHFYLAQFLPLEKMSSRSALDLWLTERYVLYQKQGNRLYRYHIHHIEWPLKNVKIKNMTIYYRKGGLIRENESPARAHYAPELQVLTWGREKCD
ncbi:MAG TPA: DUF2071 domain-containing protein [Flavobacterium sp.]|jgi:hypothetical protein